MKLVCVALLWTMIGISSSHDLNVIVHNNDAAMDLPLLNIDHMLRGQFYAASPYVKGLEGVGGWAGSDNNIRKIDGSLPGNIKGFAVFIDTTSKTEWAKRFAAQKVYVMNKGSDTVFFQAQDSRLQMNLQALDSTGEWRNIRYLPNSSCGNSCHKLFLPGCLLAVRIACFRRHHEDQHSHQA